MPRLSKSKKAAIEKAVKMHQVKIKSSSLTTEVNSCEEGATNELEQKSMEQPHVTEMDTARINILPAVSTEKGHARKSLIKSDGTSPDIDPETRSEKRKAIPPSTPEYILKEKQCTGEDGETEQAAGGPSTSGSPLKGLLQSKTVFNAIRVKKAKQLIVQTEKSITLDDVIAFIQHVKDRPLVYDPDCIASLDPGSNTTLETIEEAWIELSMLMNWSVEICKERWRSLKLAYILNLHAKQNNEPCENYRFLPYMDFMKGKISAYNLQTEITETDVLVPDEDMVGPDDEESDADECLVEAEVEAEVFPKDVEYSDPLDIKPALLPLVPNTFDRPPYPGIGEEINNICKISRIGESYFDYFRSIELHYSLLTTSRKKMFFKACSAALKHFYFENCN